MIRVLVIEEVRAICEIIATVLRSEADLTVVGCATGIDEAVAHLGACNVAVVNACMTNETSVRLVHGLRRLAPRVKVVVMGLVRSQPAILQCVEAGVAGYVLKDSPLDALFTAIRTTAGQEPIMALPQGTPVLPYGAERMGLVPETDFDGCGPQSLTRREREVLSLVQHGLTNQEIAESLVIELGTVKNHVHNILRKLNVNSRRDAVHVSRLAGGWGLSELSPRPTVNLPRRPDIRPERAASVFRPALAVSQ